MVSIYVNGERVPYEPDEEPKADKALARRWQAYLRLEGLMPPFGHGVTLEEARELLSDEEHAAMKRDVQHRIEVYKRTGRMP